MFFSFLCKYAYYFSIYTLVASIRALARIMIDWFKLFKTHSNYFYFVHINSILIHNTFDKFYSNKNYTTLLFYVSTLIY